MGLHRLLCAALIGVALAGCDGVDPITGLPFSGATAGPGIRTLIILNGSLRVRGPDGYCIDQRASRPAAGFVVMGSCALVSQTRIIPAHAGVLTFQAGEPGSAGVTGAEQALVTMMQTAQGYALLSAQGDAATVRDVKVSQQPGLVVVGYQDVGRAVAQGLDNHEWRGFADVNGRLITIAVRAVALAPLTQRQGETLVQQTFAAIRAANSQAG